MKIVDLNYIDFADYICDTDYCWWCSYWIKLHLQGGKEIFTSVHKHYNILACAIHSIWAKSHSRICMYIIRKMLHYTTV